MKQSHITITRRINRPITTIIFRACTDWTVPSRTVHGHQECEFGGGGWSRWISGMVQGQGCVIVVRTGLQNHPNTMFFLILFLLISQIGPDLRQYCLD